MTDTYDKSKGGWQRINGTMQLVNRVNSETPIIDSLLSDIDKPVSKARRRLDRPTSLTEMSGGVIRTVDNR